MRKIMISVVLMLILVGIVSAVGDNYQVEIKNAPASVNQGQTVNLQVDILNVGGPSASMECEAGIYQRSVVEDWYGGSGALTFFTNVGYAITKCEDETNVQRKRVNLPAQYDLTHETFTFIAPTTDSTIDYVFYTSCTERCYNEAYTSDGTYIGTDESDHHVVTVDLVGTQTTATCSDGMRNQDESSVDCGGVCSDCGLGYACNSASDCVSNTCVGGVCTTAGSGGDIYSKIQTIGYPFPKNQSHYNFVFGDPVSIVLTQKVNVLVEGDYFIEMGMERLGSPLSIFTVTQNTCNPADTNWANHLVHLPVGLHDLDFTLTPKETGRYGTHFAIVTGCGGATLLSVNSIENINVRGEDDPDPVDGDGDDLWLFVMVGAAVGGILLLFSAGLMRRGRGSFVFLGLILLVVAGIALWFVSLDDVFLGDPVPGGKYQCTTTAYNLPGMSPKMADDATTCSYLGVASGGCRSSLSISELVSADTLKASWGYGDKILDSKIFTIDEDILLTGGRKSVTSDVMCVPDSVVTAITARLTDEGGATVGTKVISIG